MSTPTIPEIVQMRHRLETDIMTLVRDFERATGVSVANLYLHSSHKYGDYVSTADFVDITLAI